MSSQGELRTEPPSSEAPLPSSPTPVKSQNDLIAEEKDKINASENTNLTTPSMIETSKNRKADDQPYPTKPSQLTTTTPNPKPTLTPSQIDLFALKTKRTVLESQLKSLQAEKLSLVSRSTLPSGLPMPEDWSPEQKSKAALETAQGRIKEHIALLHSYNEIKDVGLGLLGMLAEGRGVRVKDLMGEFEMGEKD